MIASEIDISSAERILMPSGRDHVHCAALLESCGIEVPTFEDRRLTAEADGRQFAIVKGKDVPKYIAEGYADIGLTGQDVCEEIIPFDSPVKYRTGGQAMCSLELLFPESGADQLTERLGDEATSPVIIATSFPNFLGKCIQKARTDSAAPLNIQISPFKVSGSVEVLPALGVCEGVADLVESGTTAKANGLIRRKLAEVLPAIVWRDTSKSPAPLEQSFPDILGIDQILAERVSQVTDPAVTSYTLEQLRDPNKATKHYGEETAEYLQAVLVGESPEACMGEFADLIYRGLVLAHANARQVTLGGVLRTLAERNKISSVYRQSS